MIIAIDPGFEESAFVIYEVGAIRNKAKLPNEKLLEMLENAESLGVPLVVEMIASYGMPVGKEVFETCVWIGRFIQAWRGKFEYVYRRDVKLHLCNSSRAKDANVRQALLDRFPPLGGGKTPQVGTKAKPGPLFGFSGDAWSALAVAITYSETRA